MSTTDAMRARRIKVVMAIMTGAAPEAQERAWAALETQTRADECDTLADQAHATSAAFVAADLRSQAVQHRDTLADLDNAT
ncbi:hypothetical protein [Luteipulveratus halotolerans]|nr:hypothetical protein [Luteipulveratus halotolerans]